MYTIGIDIGGTNTKVALFLNDKKIYHFYITTDKRVSANVFLQDLAEKINDNCEKLKIDKRYLYKIGIACPGSVSKKTGMCYFSPNLNWKNINLVKPFKTKFYCDVIVSHDGKTSCLAEQKMGALKNVKNAIYITIGTGFGGAFVFDGLVDGGRDAVAEIGHMTLKSGGRACQCGRAGCVDMYCSTKGIMQTFYDLVESESAGKKDENKYFITDVKQIFDGEKEHELYANVVEEFLNNLSEALISLINVFHPEKIVIGGGVAHLLVGRLKRLTTKIANGHLYPTKVKTVVVLGELLNDAGILGAKLL